MAFSGMAARIAAATLSAGLATGAAVVGVTTANHHDRHVDVSASAPAKAGANASVEDNSVQTHGGIPGVATTGGVADTQRASAAVVLNPVGSVLLLPNGVVVGEASTAAAKKLVDAAKPPAGTVTGSHTDSPALPGTPALPSVPPAPGMPSVPPVGVDTSPSAQGSYTLLVPGTPGVAKKLCVSGDVDSCLTMTVGALQSTTMTVAYAGKTGVEFPTYSVAACNGGLTLTVGALTPGTSVTVSANGKSVSRHVLVGEHTQTASFCDA